jgi:FkbM family methyltransferase
MSSRIGYFYSRFGVSGILAAARAKFSQSTPLFEVRRPDIRHPFYLRLRTSDLPTFDQIFVNQEYAFHATIPPRIIIDAGANIGLASIYFANKYPEAKIIAIEPESSNYEMLKINVAPYDNVIPVNAALWNRNEPLDLVDPGLDKWGFMTVNGNSGDLATGTKCHTIEGLTVDRIMNMYDLERLDLLKIDIEGAEKEVFLDSSSWIDRVDSLIVELHDRMKTGCSRSFYNGSNGFDEEWVQGENVFLTRNQRISRLSASQRGA